VKILQRNPSLIIFMIHPSIHRSRKNLGFESLLQQSPISEDSAEKSIILMTHPFLDAEKSAVGIKPLYSNP
jgi:hypothetical protein